VIGGGGLDSGFADPLDDACGGDPVRIFANLEDRLRLETKLNEGRTLRLALLELGLNSSAIDEVEAAVRGTMDLGMLTGSGAPVRIAGDRDGGVQALEIEVNEGHLIQACRSPAGLEIRNIQHPLRVDVAVIAVELPKNGDLLEAVLEVGQTADLARMISETLAGELDFVADVRPGDLIQVLVEKRYLGRHFHRYGKLLAIRYVGEAGRMAFYRYKPKGGGEAYFDDAGKPMRRTLRRTPFAWHPVDPEAHAALAPAIEFIDGHMGAVYRRALGAPVVAMADGRIRSVGTEGDDGLIVELELEDGRRVRYANLLRVIGDRAAGDRVVQGEVLALVGQTGKTPIPRLRLELLDRTGERLDPMALGERGRARAETTGDAIPDDQLAQFKDDIASWRRAMRKAAE
jgi:murein DD-endopeptidase MepM/ murein hydrolase activator NlpD